MPPVLYVVKAATPDQIGWRQRIARNEKSVLAAFKVWVSTLRTQIAESQIVYAVAARAVTLFDHVVQAVAFEPVLAPTMEEEAERSLDDLIQELDPQLHISLNLRDPNFQRMVDAQQARMVREVSNETRRAISNVIARAYRDGQHPYVIAPQIRQMVGLTSRQAQAVYNYRASLVKKGLRPEVVAARTDRYSERMLNRRAQTIARTETAKAATAGRIEGWRQAASHGLFDYATAEMEWSAVQDDPKEICYQLNGSRVPLGSTWPGGLLPGDAHPLCRCSPEIVLPASVPGVAERVAARIPAINAALGVL